MPKVWQDVKDINENAHRCEMKYVSKPLSKAAWCLICEMEMETKNTSYWYHLKSVHHNEQVACEVAVE